MSQQERVHREVVIANRTYPLKIYKQDEDKILSIVKSVNHKIEQLKSVYDAKDNQDYLAMCILQLYAQQNSSHQSSSASDNSLEPEIEKIEGLLNEALN
ncbi:MAG: cell division protein ZapA [Chitinophagales bacterium]|nr:cell division protein ZapA [Chitinophagales bacterium]